MGKKSHKNDRQQTKPPKNTGGTADQLHLAPLSPKPVYSPDLADAAEKVSELTAKLEQLRKELTAARREPDIIAKRYEGDKTPINRNIKNAEQKIAQKIREKERIGQENSGTQSAESSLSVLNTSAQKHRSTGRQAVFTLPDTLEPLPETGILYEADGKHYLEIAYWEDYENGLQECSRFHAELCAKE